MPPASPRSCSAEPHWAEAFSLNVLEPLWAPSPMGWAPALGPLILGSLWTNADRVSFHRPEALSLGFPLYPLSLCPSVQQ